MSYTDASLGIKLLSRALISRQSNGWYKGLGQQFNALNYLITILLYNHTGL